jgi:hypothetical protein
LFLSTYSLLNYNECCKRTVGRGVVLDTQWTALRHGANCLLVHGHVTVRRVVFVGSNSRLSIWRLLLWMHTVCHDTKRWKDWWV